MAKTAGRLCVIKKNGTTIGGGRTVNMTVNGAPIDTTDQNDNGFTNYLADILTGRSLQFSIDGQEEDQVLRDIALATAADTHFLDDLTFEFPNGDEISGNFVMSAYAETGPYGEAQTFNATFMSDGQWTYTQAV